MGERTSTAVIHKEGDVQYSAICPEVGTKSQGHSEEEALNNLKEATEMYLNVFPYKKQGKPVFKTFEAQVKEEENHPKGEGGEC